jgi:predicted transcriptional regulator
MAEPRHLSRRERQIMDVIFAAPGGEATASQVLAGLHDPPTRTAVRTLLGILEQKGHLSHRKVGREFVYRPTQPRGRVGRSALRRVVDVFFSGSLAQAVAAHLADPGATLDDEEAARLAQLIRKARRQQPPRRRGERT